MEHNQLDLCVAWRQLIPLYHRPEPVVRPALPPVQRRRASLLFLSQSCSLCCVVTSLCVMPERKHCSLYIYNMRYQVTFRKEGCQYPPCDFVQRHPAPLQTLSAGEAVTEDGLMDGCPFSHTEVFSNYCHFKIKSNTHTHWLLY